MTNPRRAAVAGLVAFANLVLPNLGWAVDGTSTLVAGEWRGDAIAVKWRESQRTAYSPETVILVENIGHRTVSVAVDWDSRVCGEGVLPYSAEARSFTRRLLHQVGGIGVTLRQGEWDALILPRGLPPAGDLGSHLNCVARIRLRALSIETTHDELDLVLPAPLPGPRKHE